MPGFIQPTSHIGGQVTVWRSPLRIMKSILGRAMSAGAATIGRVIRLYNSILEPE